MRKFAITTLLSTMIAAPAFALTVTDVDKDGDSVISFEEMLAVYPTLTSEAFDAVDTSGDSVVDEAELAAALDTGLIVAPSE